MPPHVLRSLHELLIELFTPEDLKILLQRDLHDAALINGRAIVRSLPEQVSAERFVWLLIEELERRGHLADAAQLDHLFEALRRARPYRSQWLDEVFALVRAQVGRDIAEPPRFARRDLKWSHVFRPALMDELRQRLERTGFVSVIGPPGIGKTEICAEYVHTQRQGPLVGADAPPPTLWIDASAVQTRSDLVVALSQSVRLPNAHDITVDKHARYLIQHLQAQYPGLLIVLDGVQETLTPDALALLEQLNGLGIGLLLSAQMATAALCEQILDAPNLTVPEATALLETLYQHLQPALTVGGLREADRAQLTRVSEALMGHPGCLIQAGNHFGTVSPRDMLPRVKRYKGLIDGALEHVWRDELSEDERTFALLLASSSCGLLLSDLEDCLGESPERDTLDVLLELRRRSWVRPTLLSRGQGTYYRYELMSAARPLVERLVGAEPFAQAQTRAREALVHRAKALAVGLHRRGWEEALDELDLRVPDLKILLKELIHSDINAAAELMLALDRVLVVRGLAFDQIQLINLVLDGNEEKIHPSLVARLLMDRARVIERTPQRSQTLPDARRALTAADQSGEAEVMLMARVVLADLLGREVMLDEAEHWLTEARSLTNGETPQSLIAHLLHIDAALIGYRGRFDLAETPLKESLSIRIALGDELQATLVMESINNAYNRLGRVGESIEILYKKQEIERRVGRPRQTAILHHSLGLALLELGNVKSAQAEFEVAVAASRQLADDRFVARSLLVLGLTLEDQQQYELALQAIGDAQRQSQAAGALADSVNARAHLAICMARAGRIQEARVSIQGTLPLLTDERIGAEIRAWVFDCASLIFWLAGDLYASSRLLSEAHVAAEGLPPTSEAIVRGVLVEFFETKNHVSLEGLRDVGRWGRTVQNILARSP